MAKKPEAAAAATMYPGMSAEAQARENDYQAQSDVRTLHEAHQIRKDPKRHARAKAHVMGMLSALKGGPQPLKTGAPTGAPKVPAAPDTDMDGQ